mgnify:FL=1|tara:strand:- start:937 stop:1113 length:177 start_codon:yes stop_codon:yes gene_type:complete
MIQIGDVINAFESEDGIHISTVESINDEVVSINVGLYTPDHLDFPLAIKKLETFNSSQ